MHAISKPSKWPTFSSPGSASVALCLEHLMGMWTVIGLDPILDSDCLNLALCTFVTCRKFHLSQDINLFFQMPIETLGEFMSLFEKASQQRFVCLIPVLACENSHPSLLKCFHTCHCCPCITWKYDCT